MTNYVPYFKDELETYTKFNADVEMPYLNLLQELVTGRTKDRDGTTINILDMPYEAIAPYHGEIQNLRTIVDSYRNYTNERIGVQNRIRGWAREVGQKINTTLTRAFGTILIRKMDMIKYTEETAAQTDRQQQEMLDKMREQRAREISKLPDLENLLHNYRI